MARLNAVQAGGIDVLGFLDMLAWSELGDALLAESDDGYNIIVGSKPGALRLVPDYHDHPQTVETLHLGGQVLYSSAAGRYQFLAKTWDWLCDDLGLASFEPVNQDRAAIELIRRCGALGSISDAGIERAIGKCAKTWASLPGAGYGQPEHSMDACVATWIAARAKYRPDFGNVVAGVESTAAKGQ